MELIMLICLALTASSMVGWGMRRPGRFLQSPTLAGMVVLGLVLPQMVGVYRARDSLFSARLLEDGGLTVTFLIHVIFYAAFAVGYWFSTPTTSKPELDRSQFDSELVFRFGVFLLAVGSLGYWMLGRLCGGSLFAFFSRDAGAYTLEWLGRPVLYLNVSRLVYPGLLCILLATLKSPTTFRWLMVGAACLFPVLTILSLGRRNGLAVFSLVMLVPIRLVRGWEPPRAVIPLAFVLGSLAFYWFPDLRQIDAPGSNARDPFKTGLTDPVVAALSGANRKSAEAEESVKIVSAVHMDSEVGFGRGIWNATVALLVPRQFVGEEFKNSLTFKWNYNLVALRVYGEARSDFTAISGPSGAFTEFWYFGALFFGILGCIMRWMWTWAQSADIIGGLMYAATLPVVVLLMVIDITQIVGYLATSCLPLLPLAWLLSRSHRTHGVNGTVSRSRWRRRNPPVTCAHAQSAFREAARRDTETAPAEPKTI